MADELTDKIIKILLWKTKITEEILNLLLMFYSPHDRFTEVKTTKVAIFSAVNFLKELPTGNIYYCTPIKTGGIMLVNETGDKNVVVTETGKVLQSEVAVTAYIQKNKL